MSTAHSRRTCPEALPPRRRKPLPEIARYAGVGLGATFAFLVLTGFGQQASAATEESLRPPIVIPEPPSLPTAAMIRAEVASALSASAGHEASALASRASSGALRSTVLAETARSLIAEGEVAGRAEVEPQGAAAANAPAPASVEAAAVTPTSVNQCNGTDNVGGQAVACDVTVTNNLNLATGETSSSVQVKECHGAANAPPTCTNTTSPSDELTTSVDQCNGSGNGGGGTVTCNVQIVNNITGVAPTSPATVNQCNGSGMGGGTQPTVSCDPIGNTTNATIDQCNDSGNGGGATMRVRCTVRPSTQTSAIPITVDQCNGSGNGGGGTVTCTTSVTNNIVAGPVTPPPVVPPVGPPVVTPPVVPPVVTPPDVPPVVPPVVPPIVSPPVLPPVVPPVTPPPVVSPPVVVPPVVPPVLTPPAFTPPPVPAPAPTPSNGSVGNVAARPTVTPTTRPLALSPGATTASSSPVSLQSSGARARQAGIVVAGQRATTGELPRTGSHVAVLLSTALLLLATGGALRHVGRRASDLSLSR